MAVLDQAGQFPGSQHPKLLFYFRENILNRIVLRRVRYIEYESEAQLRSFHFRFFAPMCRQVIQKESDLVLSISISKLLQILLELCDIYRVVVDLKMLLPFLLGNCREDCKSGLTQVSKISWHVGVQGTVFGLGYCTASKTNLVNIHDPVPIVACFRQKPLHRTVLLGFFHRIRVARPLKPFKCLLFDFMDAVYLAKQRRIHVGSWVLF